MEPAKMITKLVPPRVGPYGFSALRRKYLALSDQYAALARQLGALYPKRTSMFQLTWWMLRTSTTALALVHQGEVELANERWRKLERPVNGARGWRMLPVEGERDYPSLSALAIGEAARLFKPGGPGVSAARFARVGGPEPIEQVLSVRSERTIAAAGKGTVVVAVYDVTDRVRAERELEETRRMVFQKERLRSIGELASGVAHDLNNTLHAIGLRVALVEADPICAERHGTNLRAIRRIVDEAAAMVVRLQDFARERRERAIEAVDLAQLVDEAIDLARCEVEEQAMRRGIAVRIERDLPRLPPIRGAADEVRFVFVNLILNARDAMPSGGTIRIAAHLDGGQVVLTVSDEGTGIPEQDLERIFEPFFTSKSQGTGLGLSMAYGLLARLGGDIRAANRESGGAELTLRFPVATSERAAEPEPVDVAPLPAGRRVLIVDDDPDNLEALKAILELDGQLVDVAQSGLAALELCRAGARYDVVLCDIGMPEMNGWRVAEELQRLQPGVRVYMLTGWARELDDDERAKAASGVLAKPVDLQRLRTVLIEASAPVPTGNTADAV